MSKPLSLVIHGFSDRGVLTAVASSEGAIGYADGSVAAQFRFTVAGNNVAIFGSTEVSEIAASQVYFVFRLSYDSTAQAAAARTVCIAVRRGEAHRQLSSLNFKMQF